MHSAMTRFSSEAKFSEFKSWNQVEMDEVKEMIAGLEHNTTASAKDLYFYIYVYVVSWTKVLQTECLCNSIGSQ